MTDVITDVRAIIDEPAKKAKKDNETKRFFVDFFEIREIANSDYAKKLYSECLSKEDGKYVIKGTRITPSDIGRLISEEKISKVKDIMKEYPSIENEKQVNAATLMFAKKQLTILALIKTLLKRSNTK